jgi:hypothetical protein
MGIGFISSNYEQKRSDKSTLEARVVQQLLARDHGYHYSIKDPGSVVELIKMLPDGIGILPLFNNVR